MNRILRAAVAIFACISALAACGDDDSGPCTPGLSIACDCADGRMGSQTCLPSETYGICVCGTGFDLGVDGMSACGNGACDPGESTATCPADCPAAMCGNGACDAGETTATCPADCPAMMCGNGVCDAGETAASCPADCPAAMCGNGVCDAGETMASCPADCPTIMCGNGVCDAGETTASCPADCPAAMCGNGVCDAGETMATCPADCPTMMCGNGVCDAGESTATCPGDCPASMCGNGVCDAGETTATCAADCPAVMCGNGQCEAGETSTSCPRDCLVCGDGTCEGSETVVTCPADCVVCGDGSCDATENSANCPGDCVVCGDGSCDAGENSVNCAADCVGGCGDGLCEGAENNVTCPADCDCAVYGANSCAATARCFPNGRTADFTARGACIVRGPGTHGTVCVDQVSCGNQLVCVGDGVANVCDTLCDPLAHLTGSGACTAAGEGCFGFETLPAGQCAPTCDPFTTTGCPGGYCDPNVITPGVGSCRPVGSGTVGSACVDTSDCAAGFLCGNDNTCFAICEVGAAGGCGAGETCAAFELEDTFSESDVVSVVGTCEVGCDFDGAATCPGGEVCAADELITRRGDLCGPLPNLAPGAPCNFPGAVELSLCNGLGACISDGIGLVCTAVCRENVAPLGGTHPDCPGGTLCNGGPGDDLGLCQ